MSSNVEYFKHGTCRLDHADGSAITVLCELHFLPTLPLIRMRHVFSLEASSILAA
jgi:hypothetical protein